jgi:hypothetical protein
MSEQQDLDAIWQQAREKLLDEMGDFNRSLWDAANAAQPLMLDEDTFVLGIDPGKMGLGSHLTSTANGPLVRRVVEGVVGHPVHVELVEGTGPDAWEREKKSREVREQMAARQQQAMRETAGARAIWGGLYEELGQLFGSVRERRFPMVRAQMFAKALLAMRDAETRAIEQEPEAQQFHEEQLNRNITRIATLSDVPETIVAVEYLRVRRVKSD